MSKKGKQKTLEEMVAGVHIGCIGLGVSVSNKDGSGTNSTSNVDEVIAVQVFGQPWQVRSLLADKLTHLADVIRHTQGAPLTSAVIHIGLRRR